MAVAAQNATMVAAEDLRGAEEWEEIECNDGVH